MEWTRSAHRDVAVKQGDGLDRLKKCEARFGQVFRTERAISPMAFREAQDESGVFSCALLSLLMEKASNVPRLQRLR